MSEFYTGTYMPKVNRLGKFTGYLGALLSFCPAVMLAIVYGILPEPMALVTAFIGGASAFGVLWFVEPISYYPIVGTAGTYMAFLSGNISNMRIPCASMAQVAAGVEPAPNRAPSSPPWAWPSPLSSTSPCSPPAPSWAPPCSPCCRPT